MNKWKELLPPYAALLKLEPYVLEALIITESSGDPSAVRFEPAYMWIHRIPELSELLRCSRDTMLMMQKTSWGLCQLMGGVAYELGFKGWCTELCDPELNLRISSKHLQKLIVRQNLTDPLDIYAAWNAGSVRKISGRYVNASAVTRYKNNLLKVMPDELAKE